MDNTWLSFGRENGKLGLLRYGLDFVAGTAT
jgi:hypothetical protein